MDVVIEPAHTDDALAIAEVHIASLQAAYESLLPQAARHLVLDLPQAKPRAKGWQRWLKRSQASTVVARMDGTVTGFCALHPMPTKVAQGTIGEIAAIYVLPTHWHQGLGRRLCQYTLTEASRRGFTEVALWVLESNRRARHFYQALNFSPDGTTRVFLEHGDSTLRELRYRRNI